jgi:addiction module HigA family antidote|tara:strand:- start:408 stop:752 length:345 start_codon:yes stop_codon:yes gene_type:complete
MNINDEVIIMMKELKIPAHPTPVGEMLTEEFLIPLEVSQGQLARAMGVSRKTVNELCVGRRSVTVETALLLSKVLGTTSGFWLNLQIMNDMWQAQHNESFTEKLDHAARLVEVA